MEREREKNMKVREDGNTRERGKKSSEKREELERETRDRETGC